MSIIKYGVPGIRASFAAGGGMSLGLGYNMLEKNEEFIRFFERSIEDNIKWLYTQIENTAPQKNLLITPLVMDFDRIHLSTDSKLEEPTVEDQLKRLIKAIQNTKSLCPRLRVFPFMGYDLRKLEIQNGLKEIQELWDKYSHQSSSREYQQIESGTVLGIKLYPPIGFNPNPSDSATKQKYLKFFDWRKNKGQVFILDT